MILFCPSLKEDDIGTALTIRRDLIEPDKLRRLARRERDRRTATLMLAIANALEGMTRAEAARLTAELLNVCFGASRSRSPMS